MSISRKVLEFYFGRKMFLQVIFDAEAKQAMEICGGFDKGFKQGPILSPHFSNPNHD